MIAQTSTSRLVSLDAFRGATIAGMMLVNNAGDWDHVYAPFAHAAWQGWTYTDTIFPFFLWIIGVAMTFSFAKRTERGATSVQLALHVLQRSGIIFLLGLFLNGFPFGFLSDSFSFSTMRIPGVLQRIAVCYLVTGLIFLKTDSKQQGWITGILLVVYWLGITLIPVPGFGAGVLEPKGNLCWYVDSNLLSGHTWTGAPVGGFDPEGILSTIPSVATTLSGVLTGHLLRSSLTAEEKVARMFVYGNVLLLAGLIMDNWLPINKNLWTSSYVVFMAGLALVVLAVFYWLIDMKGYTRWSKPFQTYGLNAITVYFLAGLLARLSYGIMISGSDGTMTSLKSWYYLHFFQQVGDPMIASFLHSLLYVVGLYLVAYLMYKKQWIIKV